LGLITNFIGAKLVSKVWKNASILDRVEIKKEVLKLIEKMQG